MPGRRSNKVLVMALTACSMAWGQKPDAGPCRVLKVTTLPGSGKFASDFLEALSGEPNLRSKDRGTVWGLTADLSDRVPAEDRAMYISKSVDGGATWTVIAQLDSRYFDADIGEGERNGLAVTPGGREFVVTTQKGAWQVVPHPGKAATVRAIVGPRVLRPDPEITIPKKEGDPETANVVKMTGDGKRLLVGYGYFDLHPQIFSYRKGRDGTWVQDGALPALPTDLDLLSMQFGQDGSTLYVGTGDQAFVLRAHSKHWIQIDGVGDDSAIQSISTVGGPHLAACWGVYTPVSAVAVERVTHAQFLLHRNEDEAGPEVRAFGIEVDAARPRHEVLTSLTGVYTSKDSGQTWRRLNDVPDGEFRSAHFNADGSVIVSGIEGSFVADAFAQGCSAHLKKR